MNPKVIFGTIKPPITSIPDEPVAALSSIIAAGIQIFIFVAAIALLIYLLLGAFDWITSGGEKEKISKAQMKITNTIVGIIVLVVVLSVFCLITVDVLHLGDSCFNFTVPVLNP